MTVAELIVSREPDWRELEELSRKLRRPVLGLRASPDEIARFASLYRAVCSDLALAESYNLPPPTVARLNELVALAHNTLYRQKGGRSRSLSAIIFFDAPRWILTDVAFWIALVAFWGCFLVGGYLAKHDASFASDLLGPGVIAQLNDMYSRDFSSNFFERLPMASFYLRNNAGIGLKCFAFGILGAIPGFLILALNAIWLGVVYGYMLGPQCSPDVAARFTEFTTAHGPFELTAIVLSAAAGMRLGFGLVMTRGYTRVESLRRAAIKASPAIFVGFALFSIAACIEAFISPNPMTWLDGTWLNALMIKRMIFWLSIVVLLVYFVALGGLSILRRYRDVGFVEAARAFWQNSADVGVSRTEIKSVGTTTAISDG